MTHDWELCPASGRWVWVCVCGVDRGDFDSDVAAEIDAERHEVMA